MWYRDKRYHFFRASNDLSDWNISYRGLQKATDRDVFKAYRNKKDKDKIIYCRHMAFRHYFQRHEDQWYLEINPTYHYTRDGQNLSFFYEEKLQGIKRMERNNAVFGQVYFWAQYLSPPHDLFSEDHPFLNFGQLQHFEMPIGIDDKVWLPKEEEEEAMALDADEATEENTISQGQINTGTLRLPL